MNQTAETVSKNEPYRIRLVGPWELIGPGQTVRSTTRIPVSWRDLFGESSGTACFFRRFNQPTNLSRSSRIAIRLPMECGTVESVALNGEVLVRQQNLTATGEAFQDAAFEAFNPLQLQNLLEVKLSFDPLQSPDQAGGLHAEVFLEIHD